MSIKVMQHIWEHSEQRGSGLLMLIAIADNANEEGEAYPAVSTLAKKTRMTERNAQVVLGKLQDAGELVIQERNGTSNLYIIPVPWRKKQAVNKKQQRGVKRLSPPQGVNPDSPGGETGFTGGGESAFTGGVNPDSPKPSLNRQLEPSPEPFAPTGASQDADASILDAVDEDAPTLYPCTDADIVALIGAWWAWVPRRPVKRGKVIESRQHFANKTNREYAQNLFERGVRPSDFVECLGELRLGGDAKEMTFCYAGEVVEQWVAADRAENWYSQECPRITPRRPDVMVDLGEIAGLSPAELWQRFADHPDLVIDVPPPYISPHDLEEETFDDEPGGESDEALLADLGIPL